MSSFGNKTNQESEETSDNIENIISCKCGSFHEFGIESDGEFKIFFLCEKNNKIKIRLDKLFISSKFKLQCSHCENIINIKTDFLRIKNEKSYFSCFNCYNEKNLVEKNYNKIIDFNEEDIKINNITKELEILTEIKNEKQNTELYKNCYTQIQNLIKLINHLNSISTFFPNESKLKKVIFNFVDYFQKLVSFASENKQIYDIYRLVKECNIYGDSYEDKKFYNKKFCNFYNYLIEKCDKKKILSLEMFKYVHQHYSNNELKKDLKDSGNKIFYKNFIQEDNQSISIKSSLLKVQSIYLNLKILEDEIKFTKQVTKLKADVSKLTDELKLDKYYNSFYNYLSELTFIRKNVNFLISKIIKDNYNKLKYNRPSRKIIEKCLKYIYDIKEYIYYSNAKNYLKQNIKTKLLHAEKELTKYKNSFNKNSITQEQKTFLNLPLITFTEEERQFLKDNFVNFSYTGIKKYIEVKNNDDEELQIIIDFLYELKEKGNKTAHYKDDEFLKFYPQFKRNENIIKIVKEDDINEVYEKIKSIIQVHPKSDSFTYEQLINYTFHDYKNEYMKIDEKMDYLLSQFKLIIKTNNNIFSEYKEITDAFKRKKILIKNYIDEIKNNYKKNEKKLLIFEEKYKLKNEYEDIMLYFKQLYYSIIPDLSELYDSKNKDKLEKYLNLIITKDNKLVLFIEYFLQKQLYNWIAKEEETINQEVHKNIKSIKSENIKLLKISKIHEIIKDLKLFKFEIKQNYEEYILKYHQIKNKRRKIDENSYETKSLLDYNYFIEKLKSIIKKDEKVDIYDDETSEFLFNLFKYHIGLDF